MEFISELGFLPMCAIILAAVATACIHGATGVAGGFLMSAILALVIGVKPVVPIMSVALLISHTSRALMNIKDFDRTAFLTVIVPAVPFIVLASLMYGRMASSTIAVMLGSVVLCSIPMRRWAKKNRIETGKPLLAGAGVGYGLLAGVSIGPGMLLIPFLLGFGLAKEAFVATIAAIALTANVTRAAVFGMSDMLDGRYILLGIVIGIATIPGNWIGRSWLRKMTNENHSDFVDVLTVLGAANFFWLAFG